MANSQATDISTVRDAAVRRKLQRIFDDYRTFADEITTAEAGKKACMEQAQPLLKKLKINSLRADTWTVSKSVREYKKITAEKLLEQGVDMDTIEAATEVNVVESWQVRGHKAASE